MRPNQQNRRMRGRGNRKGPNPLTRSYESNGPDVKIRGSAQQIAEKYTALARDAQAAGDRVMAENYLQHAEHYNRIIAAAQGQMPIHTQRDYQDEYDDESELGYNGNGLAEKPAPMPVNDGTGPQPVIEGTPAEVALNEEVPASNGSAAAEQGERKPVRRVRRPRKARAEDGADQGESRATGEEGEAAGEAGEAPAPVNG